jgi:hypothetical protein
MNAVSDPTQAAPGGADWSNTATATLPVILDSLTVADDGNASNTVTTNGAAVPNLYIAQAPNSSSVTLDISEAALPDRVTTGSYISLEISQGGTVVVPSTAFGSRPDLQETLSTSGQSCIFVVTVSDPNGGSRTVDVNVIHAALKIVSFSGFNPTTRQVDPGAFNTIFIDPTPNQATDTAYGPNQWEDDSLTGTPTAKNGNGEHDFPISITSGCTDDLYAKATIALWGAPAWVEVRVVGSLGGTTLTLPMKTGATPSGQAGSSTLVTAQLNSNTALSGVAPGTWQLTLTYQVSFDGGKTWTTVGTSINTVYVTWHTPIKPPVKQGGLAGNYETVLMIGCNALSTGGVAGPNANAMGVAATIFNNGFASLTVKRADGTPLAYSLGVQFNNAKDLLSMGSGQCTEWADLLVQTFEAQGIQAQQTIVKVKHSWWTGDTLDMAPHAVQGTPNGSTAFDLHDLVTLTSDPTGIIFDPSRGVLRTADQRTGLPFRTAEQAYADTDIIGIFKGGGIPVVPRSQGKYDDLQWIDD